jgi:SEFIR domain
MITEKIEKNKLTRWEKLFIKKHSEFIIRWDTMKNKDEEITSSSDSDETIEDLMKTIHGLKALNKRLKQEIENFLHDKNNCDDFTDFLNTIQESLVSTSDSEVVSALIRMRKFIENTMLSHGQEPIENSDADEQASLSVAGSSEPVTPRESTENFSQTRYYSELKCIQLDKNSDMNSTVEAIEHDSRVANVYIKSNLFHVSKNILEEISRQLHSRFKLPHSLQIFKLRESNLKRLITVCELQEDKNSVAAYQQQLLSYMLECRDTLINKNEASPTKTSNTLGSEVSRHTDLKTDVSSEKLYKINLPFNEGPIALINLLMRLLNESEGKPSTAIQANLESLKTTLAQLNELFNDAEQALTPEYISSKKQRRFFAHFLQYNHLKLNKVQQTLTRLTDRSTRNNSINGAILERLKQNLGKLQDSINQKLNEVNNATRAQGKNSPPVISNFLKQVITCLSAPIQRSTIPLIPNNVEEKFSAALSKLQPQIEAAKKKRQKKGLSNYSCFLSYAHGNDVHEAIVAHVASVLEGIELEVYFDHWANISGQRTQGFISKIATVDWIILFGSRLYQQHYNRRTRYLSGQDNIFKAEAKLMNAIAIHHAACADKIIPVLLEGTHQTALPQPFFNDYCTIDLCNDNYITQIVLLLKTLFKLTPVRSSRKENASPTRRAAPVASYSSAASSSAQGVSRDPVVKHGTYGRNEPASYVYGSSSKRSRLHRKNREFRDADQRYNYGRDEHRRGSLQFSAKSKHELFQQFLQEESSSGRSVEGAWHSQIRTGLHYHAQGRQPDIIRRHHQQGININQPSLDESLAIHKAALCSQLAASESLEAARMTVKGCIHYTDPLYFVWQNETFLSFRQRVVCIFKYVQSAGSTATLLQHASNHDLIPFLPAGASTPYTLFGALITGFITIYSRGPSIKRRMSEGNKEVYENSRMIHILYWTIWGLACLSSICVFLAAFLSGVTLVNIALMPLLAYILPTSSFLFLTTFLPTAIALLTAFSAWYSFYAYSVAKAKYFSLEKGKILYLYLFKNIKPTIEPAFFKTLLFSVPVIITSIFSGFFFVSHALSLVATTFGISFLTHELIRTIAISFMFPSLITTLSTKVDSVYKLISGEEECVLVTAAWNYVQENWLGCSVPENKKVVVPRDKSFRVFISFLCAISVIELINSMIGAWVSGCSFSRRLFDVDPALLQGAARIVTQTTLLALALSEALQNLAFTMIPMLKEQVDDALTQDNRDRALEIVLSNTKSPQLVSDSITQHGLFTRPVVHRLTKPKRPEVTVRSSYSAPELSSSQTSLKRISARLLNSSLHSPKPIDLKRSRSKFKPSNSPNYLLPPSCVNLVVASTVKP